MKLPEEVVNALDELDAKVRFSTRIGVGIIAEITDNTTGEIYAKATGGDEASAAANAVEEARRSPKPLTKAQRTDPVYAQAASLKQQLEEANAEIAKLRAAKPPAPRRRRAAQAEPEPETAEADATAT